jgi:hypothetical protein
MSQMGKASPAALAELKQRVLWSLSKLSDRDTQQYAVEDLIAIVDRLTVDAIPTFLSCLYDTDLQQKSYARKESVRLLGIMAAVHGKHIGPHLSKIIANVVSGMGASADIFFSLFCQPLHPRIVQMQVEIQAPEEHL